MRNGLAAIDARSDRLVGAVPVGGRPGAVTFGSGSLWVANLDDQTVSFVRDSDRCSRPPRVTQDVRQRLLHDPERGNVDRHGEWTRAADDARVGRDSGRTCARDERIETAEAGYAGVVPAVLDASQGAEDGT